MVTRRLPKYDSLPVELWTSRSSNVYFTESGFWRVVLSQLTSRGPDTRVQGGGGAGSRTKSLTTDTHLRQDQSPTILNITTTTDVMEAETHEGVPQGSLRFVSKRNSRINL